MTCVHFIVAYLFHLQLFSGCTCSDTLTDICYYVYSDTLTQNYADAQALCQADNGQLAIVRTSAVQSLVESCNILKDS